MSRVTIYCLCEGYSEQNLVQNLLAPHLALRGIDIHAPLVRTRRDKRAGKVHLGGGDTFHHYQRDLELLSKQHAHRPNIYYTTLIDLYALPTDFPGHAKAFEKPDCYSKVAHLEKKLAQAASSLGLDHLFIPHFELHEFETLILVQPEALETLFLDHETAISRLKEDISDYENVEEINHTPQGAPSKRIEARIPAYEKYKGSAQNGVINVLEVIGLDMLRENCRHFDDWVTKLESLEANSQ